MVQMRFSDWLRRSNEAKPLRDAFELVDKMPLDFGLRADCFNVLQAKAENVWLQTKHDLQIGEE